MLSIIKIILPLLSAPLLACPNLSGNFLKCNSKTGENAHIKNYQIDQSIQNRITVFKIKFFNNETEEDELDELRADGKRYEFSDIDPDTGLANKIITKAYCNNSNLFIEKIYILGDEEFATTMSSFTKSKNKIVQSYMGRIGEEQITDTIECE